MTHHTDSRLRHIKKLRKRLGPIAKWVFPATLGVAVASSFFCTLTSGNTRLWGIRAVGLCFSACISLYAAYVGLMTMEAWMKKERGPFAVTLFLTILFCFMLYWALVIMVVGPRHH